MNLSMTIFLDWQYSVKVWMQDIMTMSMSMMSEIQELNDRVEILGRKVEQEESCFHLIKINTMAEFLKSEEELEDGEKYSHVPNCRGGLIKFHGWKKWVI